MPLPKASNKATANMPSAEKRKSFSKSGSCGVTGGNWGERLAATATLAVGKGKVFLLLVGLALFLLIYFGNISRLM